MCLWTAFREAFEMEQMEAMIFAWAVCVIQPYKKSINNAFDATQLLRLAAFYGSHGAVLITQYSTMDDYTLPAAVLAFFRCFVPALVSVGYLVWWIVKMKLSSRARQWRQQRRVTIDDSLLDRVNNPENYEEMEMASAYHEHK